MYDKIISLLKKRNATISEIAFSLNIERHTAATYLKALEAKGSVKHEVKGKSKIYSLTDNSFIELIKGNDEISSQIKKILSSVDEHISIQDNNYNIIWNNKLNSAGKCFEVYANRESICPNCPSLKVLETGVSKTNYVKMNKNMRVEIHPIKNQNDETIAVVEIGRKI
jgi:predicted transcriptional regulator